MKQKCNRKVRLMKKEVTTKDKYFRIRITLSVILLLFSALLMILASGRPEFAEWYSEHVYPVWVSVLGRFSGLFPFSLSEILIYILLFVFIMSLIRLIVRVIRIGRKRRRAGAGQEGRTEYSERASITGEEPDAGVESDRQVVVCLSPTVLIASWLSCVLLTVGILAFLYTVCCGINYHRRSFSEEEGIVTYQYSVEDLKEICVWLTDEVNARAGEVSRDADGIMMLDAPEGSGAVEAMEHLAEEFPVMEGDYPQPKKLIVSEILSWQGLTGIYLPFTVEANYNGDMTAYNIPFTVCHELSHLRGFMQEQEANFIAFLACLNSERTDFQYSGYLSGWVYCMNELYRADYEVWQEVRGMLTEEAEPDLTANNAFWDRYEGMISETADRINDTYLKANGQADGVQSYNRMVDLIVAYFS